jgi:predicted CoA-binding protein
VSTRQAINDFLAQRRLAVVGVSGSGKGFGNAAYKELKAKGYELYPVHPTAEAIEGDRCYRALGELPAQVGGVLVVVPPAVTERVVQAVAQAGIPRVWMQQGAESDAAVRYCQTNGIAEVHGECILMFAEPAASFHRMHRWIRSVFKRLPS